MPEQRILLQHSAACSQHPETFYSIPRNSTQSNSIQFNFQPQLNSAIWLEYFVATILFTKRNKIFLRSSFICYNCLPAYTISGEKCGGQWFRWHRFRLQSQPAASNVIRASLIRSQNDDAWQTNTVKVSSAFDKM